MNYVFKNKQDKWEALRLYTFKRYENGVYYRDAELETNKNIKLRLADIPLPNGILRIDQYAGSEVVAARLGHYALPNLTGTIKRSTRRVKEHDVQLIDNGTYQLAMVPLAGWERVAAVAATGLNPVKATSTVLNATATFDPAAPTPQVYATLLLWKKSGAKWTDAELLPVRQFAPAPDGSVAVQLANGSTVLVRYTDY